jgi:predicted nucleic-acid-binding protein
MVPVVVVDVSVVVRFLTGDDKLQYAAAANLFRFAQAGKVRLLIPPATIQETICVLERLYHFNAQAIAPKLISLLAIPNVETSESRQTLEALQIYRTHDCEFSEALLCACATISGGDVATFDKEFAKRFPQLSAYSPAEGWDPLPPRPAVTVKPKGRRSGPSAPS